MSRPRILKRDVLSWAKSTLGQQFCVEREDGYPSGWIVRNPDTATFYDYATAREIADLALVQSKKLVRELLLRFGVRSGECNTCDLSHGKHQEWCPIPRLETYANGGSQ